MIIDFHTHIFPDKIAEKTISFLSEKGNIRAFSDGTLQGLKKSMKAAGIDISVILPVATAARQVESINRLAVELNGKDGIIYAGAIHPDCENIEEVLDGIKACGLFGIKLHPDYQGVFFDDERYIKIMECAAERELITVVHAGVDVGYPDCVHCTPDMVLHVLDRLKGLIDLKLVLAHMGGCFMPDEVMKKLAGKPVYMDTSYVLDKYPEKCLEIIRAHSADRILFATDSPWADQEKFVKILSGLSLNEEDKDKIFFNNATKLLSMTGNHIKKRQL